MLRIAFEFQKKGSLGMAVKSSVLGAGIAGAFLMVLNVGVADAQDGVEGAVAAG